MPRLLDALVERLPLQWAAPSAAQRRRSGQGAASRTSPADTAASPREWRYLDELRAAGKSILDAQCFHANLQQAQVLVLPGPERFVEWTAFCITENSMETYTASPGMPVQSGEGPCHAAGSGDAAALAATAYRGLLLALPASTALWFGDLRDRGTAAAVESYTREQHSPVLLAHELAIIQVWDRLPRRCAAREHCGQG